MLRTETAINIYRSGDKVEPGIYKDLDTGSILRVYDETELPDKVEVVHIPRRFQLMASNPDGNFATKSRR